MSSTVHMNTLSASNSSRVLTLSNTVPRLRRGFRSGCLILGALLATYRNDILGEARVEPQRDRLVLSIESGATADLYPRSAGAFTLCLRGHDPWGS